jgi:hypothetical protein
MSNFSQVFTEQIEDNPVLIPRAARVAKGHHKYDPTIVNNKPVGYVAVTYVHQAFPRIMYHPEWGKEPKPDMAKFAIGCVTPAQWQGAFEALQKAETLWARKNRIKTANNEEDQARLEKIGWLLQPPLRKVNPAFDLNSEEL